MGSGEMRRRQMCRRFFGPDPVDLKRSMCWWLSCDGERGITNVRTNIMCAYLEIMSVVESSQ